MSQAQELLPFIQIIQQMSDAYGAPPALDDILNKQQRKSSWLFKNSYLMAKFQALSDLQRQRRLLMMQKINDKKLALNDPIQLKLLKGFAQLRQLMQLISTAVPNHKMQGINRIFRRRDKHYTVQWKAILQTIANDLLQQQMHFIIAMVRNLKEQFDFLTDGLIMNSSLIYEINQLCIEINTQLLHKNIDMQLVEQFYQAQSYYRKVVTSFKSQPQTINTTKGYLHDQLQS